MDTDRDMEEIEAGSEIEPLYEDDFDLDNMRGHQGEPTDSEDMDDSDDHDPDDDDESYEDDDFNDSMDGDHASALASAGWGTDEDYGTFNAFGEE